jgi:ribonuclease P protein component
MNEDFPKVLRLCKRPEFVHVQRHGKPSRTRNLVVLALPNGRDAPRFGFTVSRKVGNAVVRNQVKRWLRESVRRRRAGMGALDIVLIARGGARTAGYAALDGEVADVFRRLGR